MLFPSAEQYSDRIKEKAPGTFYVLNDFTFIPNIVGKDSGPFLKGGSAVLFKAEKNSQVSAVRFFLYDEPEKFKRYEAVCRYLNRQSFSWKVKTEFLRKEITIQSENYPAVIMDWVDGISLNQFVDRIISDPARLSKLQHDLVELSSNLETHGMGHGDLNLHHILVSGEVTNFIIRLVDYDSIYIEEFKGQNSLVSGSPGFQHPSRLASDFSATIDRFSIWILLAGLEALKMDPSLWRQPEKMGYNHSENLLFTFRDLIDPAQSRLFQHLKTLNSPALQFYLLQLEHFCAASNLEIITKPELFRSHGKAVQQPSHKWSGTADDTEWNVEIKSLPPGREVLINGIKKGITPIQIKVAKKDFGKVEVVNASEKRQVLIHEQVRVYEIDFLKQQSQVLPVSRMEADEIEEFVADHYSVEGGTSVTIRWKVRGSGKIQIIPIGDVTENAGKKEVVVKQTTHFELRTGDKSRSFTIQAQNREEPKFLRSAMQTPQQVAPSKWSHKKTMSLLWITSVLLILITGYFLLTHTQNNDRDLPLRKALPPKSAEPVNQFTPDRVKVFLNQLYQSYNQRKLPSIIDQYADTVQTYYDSRFITSDSLSVIIKDLFIMPAFYSCRPDYTTLAMLPHTQTCDITVQINEVLQKGMRDKKDSFSTKISYVIDKGFHIISEKSAVE